jgi:hypothetical protein
VKVDFKKKLTEKFSQALRPFFEHSAFSFDLYPMRYALCALRYFVQAKFFMDATEF